VIQIAKLSDPQHRVVLLPLVDHRKRHDGNYWEAARAQLHELGFHKLPNKQ
jgi:hypothetical protein